MLLKTPCRLFRQRVVSTKYYIFMATKDMLRAYHSFELAMEACLYDLSHVWIHTRSRKNGFVLNMEFVCDTMS